MLQDKAILIIEDNLLLALDLASAIEDRGGRALGPAMNVADALEWLHSEDISAAVLDCHIGDDIAQVLMCIADRRIPVVLSSITEPPPSVAAFLPDSPMLKVPLQSDTVLARLTEEIAKASR